VGAFSGKLEQGCRGHRHDVEVLTVISCTCRQYVRKTGAFADAGFAEPDPDAGGPIPRLRPPAGSPESA